MNQSSTKNIDFTPASHRIAILHAAWHEDIVMNCVNAFKSELVVRGYDASKIDLIAVPGAYEIPLQAKLLAKSGHYSAIAGTALVVDGGIYRHDFVAQAVCDAIMQVQLETEVPVLTAVLTPHNFHEHDEHKTYFSRHFVKKGTELANACDQAIRLTEHAKSL